MIPTKRDMIQRNMALLHRRPGVITPLSLTLISSKTICHLHQPRFLNLPTRCLPDSTPLLGNTPLHHQLDSTQPAFLLHLGRRLPVLRRITTKPLLLVQVWIHMHRGREAMRM